MKPFSIGDQTVGPGEPTYVIAEAGSNHNGNLQTAKKLVDVAADAGADAVKFQTFRADKVYVENSGEAEYLDDDRSLYDILSNMEMPYEWIPKLADYAGNRGIHFLSTPADRMSADKLEPYVPAFKIESFMLSYYDFIGNVAEKGKPLILSTGAHEMEEVHDAMDRIDEIGVGALALLQCVSAYPTPIDQINVSVVERYREEFDVVTGLSDHTLDPVTAPAVAVAKGASVIEKHITLDKGMEGPDHQFALEPDELTRMVSAIRQTEKAIGDGEKRIVECERELYSKARRFVQATDPIREGEDLTEANTGILAPGERDQGVKPEHYDDVLGRRANRDIEPGDGIQWDDLE